MSKATYDWLATISTGLGAMLARDIEWEKAIEAFLEVLRLTGEAML